MLFDNLPSLSVSVRLSQKLTKKDMSPGSSRSSNCSAFSLGKLCWTCLCTDRKGESLMGLWCLWSVAPAERNPCHCFVCCFDSLSIPPLSLSLSPSLPHADTSIPSDEMHFFLLVDLWCVFLFVCRSSWTYGSNSLPTAGSVSGGVGRRGQRQFQMTPRGLPAGRINLLSPGGIGGASPRHTLTSPALAGQGRQVSMTVTGRTV